jgi:hypothetical protein
MNESEMLAALVALAKTHPYAAATIALWFVLATGWKAQPKERRDAWAKAYPRPVSALRFALELLPDLLGAGRVFVFGILRGMASRESAPQLSSDPRSPVRGEIREAGGIPPSAEQINDDGTPPAQYVSRVHVAGCDCRACASSPGYVDGAIARVIAGVALLFVGVSLAAGCSGGSLRDALRFNGVREVRHPVHGDCIEASLTVTAESINRSGTGYLGVCRGVLDAGAVGDAGGAE